MECRPVRHGCARRPVAQAATRAAERAAPTDTPPDVAFRGVRWPAMTAGPPAVSVVTPVYTGETNLLDAIERGFSMASREIDR